MAFGNGAGTIGGKLYVPGGVVDGVGAVRDLYEYTPSRNTWTRKANLPKRVAQGVTGVINGKLYVFAGSCDDCAGRVARLFRYDPITNTWTGALPSAPSLHVGGGRAASSTASSTWRVAGTGRAR